MDTQAMEQGTSAAELREMQHHVRDARLHQSDLREKLDQLREQRAALAPKDRAQMDKAVLDAQHEYASVTIDAEMTQAKLQQLIASQNGTTTAPPPAPRVFDREQVRGFSIGAFLLMIPIVIALSRRIWVRSAPRKPAALDIETSPRFQRLEEAIESIAIEVERIGEAQRFVTKVLAERPEPRVPASIPTSRREPGTITPH